MKAILLAAGFGTRLLPYTKETPKCLLKIKGEPLLGLWFEKLLNLGIDEFLINTHYLHEQVEDYVLNSKFKNNIKIINEKKLKGTAGTLQDNLDFFKNEDGLLIHADNYCEDSLELLLKSHEHRYKNTLLTMLTFKTDNPSECGIVTIDKNNVVQSYQEKKSNPNGRIANGAVFILSRKFIMEYNLFFANAFDFSAEIIPKLIGRINTFETNKKYLDIGTPKNYLSVK